MAHPPPLVIHDAAQRVAYDVALDVWSAAKCSVESLLCSSLENACEARIKSRRWRCRARLAAAYLSAVDDSVGVSSSANSARGMRVFTRCMGVNESKGNPCRNIHNTRTRGESERVRGRGRAHGLSEPPKILNPTIESWNRDESHRSGMYSTAARTPANHPAGGSFRLVRVSQTPNPPDRV